MEIINLEDKNIYTSFKTCAGIYLCSVVTLLSIGMKRYMLESVWGEWPVCPSCETSIHDKEMEHAFEELTFYSCIHLVKAFIQSNTEIVEMFTYKYQQPNKFTLQIILVNCL